MLNADDFGSEVVYKPQSGSEITVNVIVDSEPVQVDVGDNNEYIQDNVPMITARRTDFSEIPGYGDQFEIDGQTFDVWKSEDNRQGTLTVYLRGRFIN